MAIVKIIKHPVNSGKGYFYNDSSNRFGGHYVAFIRKNKTTTGTISLRELAEAMGYRISDAGYQYLADLHQCSDWPFCQSLNETGWNPQGRNGLAVLYATRAEANVAFHMIMAQVWLLKSHLQFMLQKGTSEKL